jgi:hypothetical protein
VLVLEGAVEEWEPSHTAALAHQALSCPACRHGRRATRAGQQ